jgi:hypothetical protein
MLTIRRDVASDAGTLVDGRLNVAQCGYQRTQYPRHLSVLIDKDQCVGHVVI